MRLRMSLAISLDVRLWHLSGIHVHRQMSASGGKADNGAELVSMSADDP